MKKKHVLLFALPYLIYFIGAALNQIATHANGLHMPVQMPGNDCSLMDLHSDPVHVCMTQATHLKVLCDWIISSSAVSSIGDYLLELGDTLRIPALIAFLAVVVKDAFGKN